MDNEKMNEMENAENLENWDSGEEKRENRWWPGVKKLLSYLETVLA